MTRRIAITAVLSSFLAWSCGGALRASAATPERPAPSAETHFLVAIPHVSEDLSLTVNLELSPWRDSAAISGFSGFNGGKAAERNTQVYLAYDDSALWVAFRCLGRGRDSLKAAVTDRDGPVWRDDSVEFLCVPGANEPEYYQVVLNSAGAVYDAAGKDAGWNPEIQIATAIDDRGWSGAMRIPFKDMGVSPIRSGAAWAVNFCRSDSAPERTCWSPTYGPFTTVKRFGRMLFAGDKLSPARLLQAHGVVIGANEWLLSPMDKARYELQGTNHRGDTVLKESGNLSDDGKLSFFVADDKLHHLDLTIKDKSGQSLARSRQLMRSPAVADRVARLKTGFAEIEKAMPRVPKEARRQMEGVVQQTQPLLTEATRLIGERGLYTAENWRKLASMCDQLDSRLNAAWTYAATLNRFPKAGFAVGLESPMRKVLIKEFPFDGRVADRYELALARNEHEGLQIVVIPFHKKLKDAAVSVSPPRSRDGKRAMNGGRVQVSLVGHVEVADDPPYPVDYHGWYPDPLLDFQQSCDVAIGEQVAFWIDVSTARATPAGGYESTIRVSAQDCEPIELRLAIEVWDFELCDGTHLRNAFTYNEPQTASFYRDRWSAELARKYHDFILDHRLNIDHLYRRDPPDVGLMQYGAQRGMNAFNGGGAFRRGANEKRDPELDRYIRRLKERNLFDLAYAYGFDEVKEDKFAEMKEVFGAIHRNYPGLETMTTAADHSFGRKSGLRDVVDIWVPVTDWYDQDEAHRLRAEGKEMWWYICVVPVHPYANWFVEYPAIEARLLTGAMTYKHEAGGFLYYLINLWDGNRKPITSGPYTDWNPGSLVNEEKHYTANGDGSLLCPGPDGPLSTIRLENIRDGFEDYEYLWLLRQTAEAVRKLPSNPDRKAFLDRAQTLLAVPDSVVREVVHYTRDPDELAAYRRDLAEAILAGQVLTPTRGAASPVTPRSPASPPD